MENLTKVFIVDDHNVIVDALKSRFNKEEGLIFGGRAKNIDELFQNMSSSVDILLLDKVLEDRALLEAVGEISKKFKKTKVVIFTGKDDLKFVQKAMASGVAGYISKTLSMDEICRALRKVNNGQMTFEIGPDNGKANFEEEVKVLTNREKQVLCLLSKGYDYVEAAKFLSEKNNKEIKPSTIEKHKGNAKDKLKDLGVIHNDIGLGLWIAESKLCEDVNFT